MALGTRDVLAFLSSMKKKDITLLLLALALLLRSEAVGEPQLKNDLQLLLDRWDYAMGEKK